VKRFFLALSATALLGAAPPAKRIAPPGEGVLCTAVLLHFARNQGEACFPEDDPAFQSQLRSWTDRFDDYLVRNLPGGAAQLDQLKKDQGVGSPPDKRICEFGDDYRIYENYRDANRENVMQSIDELLSRDGLPTFGDCL
jgi:hypothetical protein